MALEHRRAGSLRVGLLLIAITIVAPPLHAQTSSSSRVLSATVVGSHVTRNGELTLIVLWRGSPGWFSRSNGSSSGGGGGSSAGRDVGSLWLSYGGKTFSVEFDYTDGIARLLNQEIRLRETNVVLVDDVDSASGALIVGRHWVDPKLPERPARGRSAGTPDQILAMIASDPLLVAMRRDPALGAYLQCEVPAPVPDGLDASVPDPAARARLTEYMQGMIAMICRQAVGP